MGGRATNFVQVYQRTHNCEPSNAEIKTHMEY